MNVESCVFCLASPLSGSLRLCYHGDGMLPISPPLNPHSPSSPPPPTITNTTTSFSLAPLSWFQCYHGDTCLSPLFCYLFHVLPCFTGSVSLCVCLSHSLFVCVPLACLSLLALCLFVFCFMYLHGRLTGCFSVSVPACVCFLSHSFFSFSLRLTGCLSGHQAFPPLIPPLLFLLCCSAPTFPLTSTSLPSPFSPPTHLFVPTSKQYPLNVTGNTQYKKESERERKKGGI